MTEETQQATRKSCHHRWSDWEFWMYYGGEQKCLIKGKIEFRICPKCGKIQLRYRKIRCGQDKEFERVFGGDKK